MIAAILLLAAAAETAPLPVARVAEDARVIDRVAEVSKRDLPTELLKRLVEDDIEMLRGKRSDGTYAYATYERLESGRRTNSFSVDNKDAEKPTHLEMKGSWVYRLVLEVPTRKMLLTHNHRIFVDHVDIEYMPASSTATRVQTLKVGAWIEPGATRTIDIDDVARQATAAVFVHADADYGNIVLSLLEAKIVDNSDSPYADAVSSAKAIQRALDHSDIPSIRAMASRISNDLQPASARSAIVAAAEPAPSTSSVEVTPARADADLYNELLGIEDLLTGSEAERHQGVDRLHQLIRRLRQSR